eukprot:tig00000282_g23849.t1
MEALVAKLAHQLRDVRVRALKSLLFKLENGLAAASELVQLDAAFVHLLEWFNHDDCTCETEALRLIELLAAEPAGAAGFIRIGGMQFFDEYRAGAPPELQGRLDAIQALLLRSPMSAFAPEARPKGEQEPRPVAAATSATSRADGWPTSSSSASPRGRASTAPQPPQPVPEPTLPLHDAASPIAPFSSTSAAALFTPGAASSGREGIYEVLAATAPKYDPRFVERTVAGAAGRRSERVGTQDRLTYPHVHTTRADDQWLLEWEVRLKMTDSGLVADALAALRAHVLPALPSEVLLQPCGADLLSAILATLRTGGGAAAGAEAAAAVRTEALRCVEAVARGWAASLRFLCEPGYRLPAREGEEGPRDATAGAAEELHYPSVRRAASQRAISSKRIAQQSVEALLAAPPPSAGGEPAMGLETAAHLCISAVLPALRQAALLAPALAALRALLPFAVPRLRGLAPGCGEREAGDEATRVRGYLVAAAEAIAEHGAGDGAAAVAAEPLLAPAVHWTLDLLSAVPERWQTEAAPGDLLRLYSALALDEYVGAARPQLRGALLPVLRRLDPASVDEMEYGRRVLAAARESAALDEGPQRAPIARAREWLHGLQYQPERAVPVLDALLRAAGEAQRDDPAAAAEAVLAALSFPHGRVRAAAYGRLRNALLDGPAPLGLWEVALGGDLLFHLLSRGLDDLEPAAASAASALVLAAAERLDGAGCLAAALGPLDAWILARAAGEAAEDDGFENRAALPGPFGRLARALEQRLSAPDRLRHLIRALFSGAEWARREAAEALRLAEPAALDFLDALDGHDRVRLGRRLRDPFGSLLDADAPGDEFDEGPASRGPAGSFQASEFAKLQRIYQGAALDPELRRAAAEQLALALRDPRFSAAFADESLFRSALADLREAAAAARGGDRAGAEGPAASVLSSLCRLLPGVRRTLRDEPESLRALVPYVFHPHTGVRREASAALAWALFSDDEEARARGCRTPALFAREALEGSDAPGPWAGPPLPAPLAAAFRFAFAVRPCALRGPAEGAVPPASPRLARSLAAAWHLERVGAFPAPSDRRRRRPARPSRGPHARGAGRDPGHGAPAPALGRPHGAGRGRRRRGARRLRGGAGAPRALCEADPAAARAFAAASWPDAFRRFLSVAPSTPADEELLAALLRVLWSLCDPAAGLPASKARLILSAACDTLVPLLAPGRPLPAASPAHESARARLAAASAAHAARERLQLAALVFLRRLLATPAPAGRPAPPPSCSTTRRSPLPSRTASWPRRRRPPPRRRLPDRRRGPRARSRAAGGSGGGGGLARRPVVDGGAGGAARGADAAGAGRAGPRGRLPRQAPRAGGAGAVLAALAAAPERDAASRSPGALVAECGGAALGAALAFLSDREARVRALAGAVAAQLARWPDAWPALAAAHRPDGEEGPAPGWLRAAAARAGDARECAAVRQEALACVANYVAASWCLEAVRDEAGTPGLCRAAAALLSSLLLAGHRPAADALLAAEGAPARWGPWRPSCSAPRTSGASPRPTAAPPRRRSSATRPSPPPSRAPAGRAALRAAVAQRTPLLASAAGALGEAACGAEARAPLAALVGNLLHRCPEAGAALAEAGPAAAPALLRGACAALEGRDPRAQLAACQLVATLTAGADAAMRRVLDGKEAEEAEPRPRPQPGGGELGARLSGRLVRLYGASRSALDGAAPDRGQLRTRAAIAGALVNVLAASRTGTRAALEAGLPAALIAAAEEAHAVASSLGPGGGGGGGEWGGEGALRHGAAVAELVLSLALLKNLAAGSQEAKAALLALRVSALLERLWPLAAREGEALQVELLGLVANLAARCPEATRALLLHSSASAARPSPAAPSAAALLLQLAGGRGSAWRRTGRPSRRSPRWPSCPTRPPRRRRRRRPGAPGAPPESLSASSVAAGGGEGVPAAAARQAALLHFLGNLAFSHEGQLAIVRTPGLVGHAVELLEERRGAPAALRLALRAGAALLLRNLAFLQEAKPHILAPGPYPSLVPSPPPHPHLF